MLNIAEKAEEDSFKVKSNNAETVNICIEPIVLIVITTKRYQLKQLIKQNMQEVNQ